LPPMDELDDVAVDETGLGGGMLVDVPCEMGGKVTGEPAADGRP
jgi:hypothetical protein